MGRTTIGRWLPRKQRIAGNRVAMCDQCGAHYYLLTQLVRKPGGALLCIGPGTLNDAIGRDGYELSIGNAEGATETTLADYMPVEGGSYDDDI